LLKDTNGRLHADGRMALEYPDGWGIHALHGVRFNDRPEWVIVPSEKLDAAEAVKITNAEQRREVIRKIGVERLLAHLPHRELNKVGDYTLLSLNLGDGATDARYLRMLNPSIGVWHLEGVHPSCATVQEAINWRATQDKNQEWNPTVLT
jgi:hypothetical protein